MIKRLPIGVEDFVEATNYYYIDKTLILKELIDVGFGKTILITRPRRFGKSLTLSMINYFFSNNGNYYSYFKDKKILLDKKYTEYLNKYPVIKLNMKNITASNFDSLMNQTCELISKTYRDFKVVLNNDELLEFEKERFLRFATQSYTDIFEYVNSINFLAELLYKTFSKKVIILIDEYDTPLNNAYEMNFYDKAISFYKAFYSSTLKANEYSLLSVVTGVLQVSKESNFSELNNLNVFNVVDPTLEEYFGFTLEETKKLLKDFNIKTNIDLINEYYGGYGNKTAILNPWSVLNYIQKEEFDTFWVNTGSNKNISSIISKMDGSITLLNEFINNKQKTFKFNSSLSYNDIDNNAETLFSFLVQAGYLVAKKDNGFYYNLQIPNKEIKNVFTNEIINRNSINLENPTFSKFKEYLLTGNNDEISNILSKLVESFSYYELTNEKEYQVMIMTILSLLFTDYIVKSEVNNRYGRCDIMLLPKNNKNIGIIIELKKYKGRLSKAQLIDYCDKAITQIKDLKYFNELKQYGCKSCFIYGFVFDSAKNFVKYEEI